MTKVLRAWYADRTPDQLRAMRDELMDFAVRNEPGLSSTLRERIFRRLGALNIAAATYDLTGSTVVIETEYAWYQIALDVLAETDDLRPADR